MYNVITTECTTCIYSSSHLILFFWCTHSRVISKKYQALSCGWCSSSRGVCHGWCTPWVELTSEIYESWFACNNGTSPYSPCNVCNVEGVYIYMYGNANLWKKSSSSCWKKGFVCVIQPTVLYLVYWLLGETWMSINLLSSVVFSLVSFLFLSSVIFYIIFWKLINLFSQSVQCKVSISIQSFSFRTSGA